MSRPNRSVIITDIRKASMELAGEHECPYRSRLVRMMGNLSLNAARISELIPELNSLHLNGTCPPTTLESGEPTELWLEWTSATRI